jgi:hypothetical protein
VVQESSPLSPKAPALLPRPVSPARAISRKRASAAEDPGGPPAPIAVGAQTDIARSIRRLTFSSRQLSALNRRKLESFEHLLIFTKPHAPPPLLPTLRSGRFLVRLGQTLGALAAFSLLFANLFLSPHLNLELMNGSGAQLLLLTSVTSVFVSTAAMVLYLLPHVFGIPPHRYLRTGPVEIGLDVLFMCLWVATTLLMGTRDTYCVRLGTPAPASPVTGICATPLWWGCVALAALTTVLYVASIAHGVRDARKSKEVAVEPSHIMFARGGWLSK